MLDRWNYQLDNAMIRPIVGQSKASVDDSENAGQGGKEGTINRWKCRCCPSPKLSNH